MYTGPKTQTLGHRHLKQNPNEIKRYMVRYSGAGTFESVTIINDSLNSILKGFWIEGIIGTDIFIPGNRILSITYREDFQEKS